VNQSRNLGMSSIEPENEEETEGIDEGAKLVPLRRGGGASRVGSEPAASDAAGSESAGSDYRDLPLRRPPNRTLTDEIGKSLRMVYDDIVAQPVPDRFLDLLKELEDKTLSPGKPGKEGS